MRHVVAGGVLFVIALAFTFGVAAVLQDRATKQKAAPEAYAPPAMQSPGAKPKPGENARVFMMSRRMNDENNERSETNTQ